LDSKEKAVEPVEDMKPKQKLIEFVDDSQVDISPVTPSSKKAS